MNDELKTLLPPVDDRFRWKVRRTEGNVVTSPGWVIELQKKGWFRWRTVSRGWSNIHENKKGIADAASRIIFRYHEFEDAANLEGVVNGNPEYRKK